MNFFKILNSAGYHTKFFKRRGDMIWRELILITTIAMIVGCVHAPAIPPHKAGSNQDINAIKLTMSQQEAIEIIKNSVKDWVGSKNKYEIELINLLLVEHLNRPRRSIRYSGDFTVTPIGVNFTTKVLGLTEAWGKLIQTGNMNIQNEFEFSEIQKITVARFNGESLPINIFLDGDDWRMVGHTNSYSWDAEKKLLAALEILCPNLLK